MTDKKLEFKFAHITGQAMRYHWGPIVERIAEETADWRDEWIYDLITENERLREALIGIRAEIDDMENPFNGGAPDAEYGFETAVDQAVNIVTAALENSGD